MVIVKKPVCNQSAFFTIVCKKEVTSKFDLIFTKLSSLYMYICYHPNEGCCVSTHSHFANFSGNDLTRIKRNSYFMEKK